MTVYAAPPGQRFGYDIDGSAVYWDTGGALTAFSSADTRKMNNEADDIVFDGPGTVTVVFPQGRSLYSIYVNAFSDVTTPVDPYDVTVEVSANTTTGSDGTWSTWAAASPFHCHPVSVRPSFRTNFTAVDTSLGSIKGVRIHLPDPGAGSTATLRALHLYGAFFTSDTTALQIQISGGPGPVFAVSQGDTLFVDATLSNQTSGVTPSNNVVVTVEALTDPAGKALATQASLSDGSGPGAERTFVAQLGPVALASGYSLLLLAVANDADLGGPWCIRIRADGDSIHSGVLYLYIDEVNNSDPTRPMIVSVTPNASLIAGASAVTVKARGVGATQAARSAVLTVRDNLSTFSSDPITATSWTPVGPGPHAYDGSREVSRFACTPDHVELVFTVPPEVIGLTDAYFEMDISALSTPQVGTYTADESLSISATAYLSGSSAASDTSAGGAVVIRQDAQPISFDPTQYGYDPAELLDTTLYPPTPMVQRHFVRTRAPYAVVDGLAVDPPILGAMSKSVAYARSWSPTMDLGDQIALGLMGATARWLPDTADITGGNTWHPHFGSAPNFTFSPLGLTPPYVDPNYDYYARYEKLKHVAAMVFDGGSWATFGGPSAQAGFSWVIVAVLHHPANRAHYDIIASPSTATDPDRATDATLRYDHGWLRSFGGARLSSTLLTPPTYKGRDRPVILAWSEGPKGGTLGVVGGLGRHWQDYAHPNRSSYDLRMKLGQNGSVDDPSYAAEMDVLDIMYWDTRLTRSFFAPVVNQLDGAYGVSDR